MTRRNLSRIKRKFKLKKARQNKLRRLSKPLLIGLAGFAAGLVFANFAQSIRQPANLVWAADDTVKIPRDLRNFLEDTDNDCESYRGTGTPRGIGLWGVYQVSHDSYAKIAYGCSWSLSSYILAVKSEGQWQLLPPAEYFAPFKDGVDPTKGALPFCSVVERFKIPRDVEPFCVLPDASAKSNEL